MSMYFPKRDELSLRSVLALPNDSRIGFDCRTCCSMHTPSSSPSPSPSSSSFAMPYNSLLPAFFADAAISASPTRLLSMAK